MSSTVAEVEAAVEELTTEWKGARADRQLRRHLEQADFDRLRDAGFWQLVVPEDIGGLWRSVSESTGTIAGMLRRLAGADPSVALVSSMHPAVIGFWLAPPDPARPARPAPGRLSDRRRRPPVGHDHLRAGERW